MDCWTAPCCSRVWEWDFGRATYPGSQSSKCPWHSRYFHSPLYFLQALIPVWPKRSTFVAKRSVATYASFGLLVWFLKGILIDRSNRNDSISKFKDAAKIVREEGVRNSAICYQCFFKVSVIIFPEGTRGDGKSGLLPFKKGAFHLAVQAQVCYLFSSAYFKIPIQPIVIGPYSGFRISERTAKKCRSHSSTNIYFRCLWYFYFASYFYCRYDRFGCRCSYR